MSSEVDRLLQEALRDHQSGRLKEAAALYRRIIEADPNHADALHLLGVIHLQGGDAPAAIALIGRAIAMRPGVAIYYNNLGNALRLAGKLPEAEAMFRRAVELDPSYADARVNLGGALANRGELEGALGHLRRAAQLQPASAMAQLNLGNVFHEKGDLDSAERAFRRAIELEPDSAKAWNNLGLACQELARAEEAEACFRRAIELDPAWAEAGSNLLLCLHYAKGDKAGLLHEEHRKWSAQHAAVNETEVRAATHLPANGRRLRIGYVSADFHNHPVGFFIEPVLAGRDRESFEVFCYSSTARADLLSGRVRSAVDQWREVQAVSDERLAEMVRKDRIDVLVDLGGHTARNRLLAFARRPASAQVTYLGYPNTTGLEQMQYRFTDDICDPPGKSDGWHSERLVRLTGGFLCYVPPGDAPLQSDLAADTTGHITFGSFNNLAKITDDLLKFWAEILWQVDKSRLVLKARGLGSESAKQHILEVLSQEGISSDRIELIAQHPSFSAHLAAYSKIDIALDAFPYNGTMTTCEALWMGVPVLNLCGETHVTRVGRSILTAVGLPELSVESRDDLVRLSAELAHDPGRLRSLRRELRGQMQSSPLCDRKRLVGQIEGAYREFVKRSENPERA